MNPANHPPNPMHDLDLVRACLEDLPTSITSLSDQTVAGSQILRTILAILRDVAPGEGHSSGMAAGVLAVRLETALNQFYDIIVKVEERHSAIRTMFERDSTASDTEANTPSSEPEEAPPRMDTLPNLGWTPNREGPPGPFPLDLPWVGRDKSPHGHEQVVAIPPQYVHLLDKLLHLLNDANACLPAVRENLAFLRVLEESLDSDNTELTDSRVDLQRSLQVIEEDMTTLQDRVSTEIARMPT